MPRKHSIYGVHPSYAYQAAIIANLKEKTGRTLQQWLQLLKKSGPATAKERHAWLKSEHGLGMTQAHLIAEHADGKGDVEEYDPERLVEELFAGPRANLRPLYEQLLDLAAKLGRDVTACPCKTIVPLYRRHVFAQIKPTTRTRIDLGLALKDTKATGRLAETGGRAKGDRITHCLPISSSADIDGEVERWLKVAYDLDA